MQESDKGSLLYSMMNDDFSQSFNDDFSPIQDSDFLPLQNDDFSELSQSIIESASLNSAQKDAVETVDGPLLVLAGAGSGKTRVLTYRIAHMVADLGIEPYQILAITFTNKAAAEMRGRISELLGSTRGMWVLTFHSLCMRMLRTDAHRVGFTNNFTIYNDDDSKRLVKEIYSELNINPQAYSIQGIRSRISKAKNELIDAEEYERRASASPLDRVTSQVYTRLTERLQAANAMDFDDLLMYGYKLLAQNPQVLEAYQYRFRYISVDEYQDTNHVQYEITKLLAQKYRNIMVVGDDDQSIYSWRGADIQNILDFEKDYKDAKTVKLEENYRSTATILDAANAVISHNSKRKAKKLFTSSESGDKIDIYLASDERDEGRWIATQIEKNVARGYRYSDMAVFYRTNAQSRTIEDMFLRVGIPYQIAGGTRFFDRAEIRDVMAYLNLVVNPADDVSAKRVINTPKRGIGKASVEYIETYAAKEGITFMEAVYNLRDDSYFSKRAQTGLHSFCIILEAASSYTGSLRDVVELIVSQTGLIDFFQSQHTPEANSRIENIYEFYGVVSEFEKQHSQDDDEGDLTPTIEAGITEGPKKPEHVDKTMDMAEMAMLALKVSGAEQSKYNADLREPNNSTGSNSQIFEQTSGSYLLAPLMEWLSLRSDLDSIDDSDSQVTLMTIHSAKGLEFPIVFIAGMEEGIFPHSNSIFEDKGVEEERRLAYVAITRAREHLSIVCAQQRSLFGSTQNNPKSRFLKEIPDKCLNLAGVGSQGYSGTGHEKRGSRRGIYGSGTKYEQSSAATDGRIFGGSGNVGSTGASGAKESLLASSNSNTCVDTEFHNGDSVVHKVFGRGIVVDCQGDLITVVFANTGESKKLLTGYAPIIKVE